MNYDDDELEPVPGSAARWWAIRVCAFVLFALFFMFVGMVVMSLYSEAGGRF